MLTIPLRMLATLRFRAEPANKALHLVVQLPEIGVTEDRELTLEYFFYTNANEKAAALAAELKALGYQSEYRLSASSKRQYLVTGWTVPMRMDVELVAGWTRRMCEVGCSHDCEFDGSVTPGGPALGIRALS